MRGSARQTTIGAIRRAAWLTTLVLFLQAQGAAARPATPAAGATPQSPPAAAPAEGKVGRFTLITRVYFNPVPKNLQSIDVWFPSPYDDRHQKIYQRFISAPYNVENNALPDLAGVSSHMKSGPRGGVPMQALISFHVERFEQATKRLEPPKGWKPSQAERTQDLEIASRWLRPEKFVTVDKEMKSRALKIVSGRRKPHERARAIYDHLVANLKPVIDLTQSRGSGYGNAAFVLREMKGDSVDMSAAFVGLCRALEIPARTVIGLRIPQGREGPIAGYHSWAEFHLPGVGWVPVDVALGQAEPGRRDYHFGSLDERRVAISAGRDISLQPPQAGPPLNYFINPYWEGDGKEMPTPYVEVAFKEIDEIPGKLPPPESVGSASIPPAPASAAGKRPLR